MQTALQLADVLDLLQAGQTVLVPTQEAAAGLRRQFDLRQRTQNLNAWEPPKLFSWSQWLASLWDSLTLEGLESRVLLNPLQEESLWADLANSAGLEALPTSALRALARQASSALTLAAAYQAVDRLATFNDSSDAHAFATWHRAFEAHCSKYRLLSRALLASALTSHTRSGRITAPSCLYLIAFEQLDPSQNGLLDALRTPDVAVHLRTLSSVDSPRLQGSFVVPGDSHTELRWAVRRLRQYLTDHPDPVFPVALILPDPERERPLLESLLREFLAPELEPVTQDLSSTPWHFSGGPALASQAPILHALQLLRWILGELSTETIGALLLSPYLAQTAPFEARARFETQILRRTALLRPEMTLQAFLSFASSVEAARAGDDRKHLSLPEWQNLQALLNRAPRKLATYGEWAEYIRRFLQTAGWPGPRMLSPAEFRLTEAWDGALDLLATLDLHGRRLTLLEFLAQLTTEVQRIQVKDAAPAAIVQILRPSEAEGRLFDAVLVLRARDDLWPPPESAHPLLSWALQKDLGMPGTNASQSQERSLALLRSLSARCPTLLLVTADHDANGPVRLTELAGELRFPPLPSDSSTSFSPVVAPLAPEVFDDSPLPPLPSTRIAGGARVLELQASCGFRAFAGVRLNAAVPESRTLGGDARESGQDLHKALEVFWHGITSQRALRALSSAERHAAVAVAVGAALESRRRAQPAGDRWTDAYLDVAQRRLTHLMLHWLETELLRGNFAVVQQEEKQLICVGPLELSIRPDRIDEVEGGLVFVDYKTSQSLSVNDWLGGRPLAPQLPLYALLAEPEEVRGLAFGRVRAGTDMGWISLQSETGLFPGKGSAVAGDLREQVKLWQTELARLAEEFADGIANVDPKSYPKTCEFCQFRVLCRLDPAELLTASAPDLSKAEQEEEDHLPR